MKKGKIVVRLFALVIVLSVFMTSLVDCKSNDEQNNASNASSSEDMSVNAEPKKRVAITFDDGPHNVRTALIVDELAKYGYHATFFVVGNRVDGTDYNGSSGLKYAADAGNEIGVHGYTHSYYYDSCDDATYRDELSKT